MESLSRIVRGARLLDVEAVDLLWSRSYSAGDGIAGTRLVPLARVLVALVRGPVSLPGRGRSVD
jgi:uncharacterized membrane-anchored protein